MSAFGPKADIGTARKSKHQSMSQRGDTSLLLSLDPLIIALELQAKLLVVDPEIAVGAACYHRGHHLLHFLRHDPNVYLSAAVVAETVQAEPVVQAINKDDVVLEPDIRSPTAATSTAEAATATPKASSSTAKAATAKPAPHPKSAASLCAQAAHTAINASAVSEVRPSLTRTNACTIGDVRPSCAIGDVRLSLTSIGSAAWSTVFASGLLSRVAVRTL